MGILDNVSGLEDIVSGIGEEKPKQKTVKAETDKDAKSNSRLEKIEDSVRSLKKAVDDMRNSVPQSEMQPSSVAMEKLQSDMEVLQETVSKLGKEKGGSGENNLQDILRRLDEMESSAPSGGKDYSGEIRELRKSVSEIRNSIASGAAKGGEPARAPAKDLLELKSRMDVLQKYVDGKFGSIDRIVEDRLRNSAAGGKETEMLKKYEERISDMERKQGEMLKMKEEMLESLKEYLQHSLNGFKSGIDRHIGDAAKKMDELSKRMDGVSAYGPKMLNPLLEEDKRINERLNEFSKRLDSIRNDAAKMVSEALKNIPKRDDIRKDVDEKVNGKLAEFSKKVDELSRYDLGKLQNVADAEKRIDENLKLFALNSDVEKVWKETESLRRYVDEKTKMADSLANSLRVWESRNMQVMEKEHDFDEKLKVFPELKLLDSKIRKMERALVELQRHFVAAQITEPIIME